MIQLLQLLYLRLLYFVQHKLKKNNNQVKTVKFKGENSEDKTKKIFGSHRTDEALKNECDGCAHIKRHI